MLFIGFGLTRLLGFDLLPRIKAINRVRLYRAGPEDSYPQLGAAVLNRPIRWDLIADRYDQMIKYATAIRTRSAETAAILRRFQQTNLMHPTYQAMLEPTVIRIRSAAQLLGEDVWIAIALPSPYEGADDMPEDAAITRWSSVVAHSDELDWLREALAFNAVDAGPDDEI